MDAQHYYVRGIAAVKQGDMVNGRKLLLQSLKLDRNNDKAWLWVARTMSEPDKQLQCADHALAINPDNRDALKLKQSLTAQPVSRQPSQDGVNTRQIQKLMREANTLVRQGQKPAAVDKWVMVLDIQSDHEDAIRLATQYFMERKMLDEVRLLLYNAVDNGTDNASILLSALDVAQTEHDTDRLDSLHEKIASSPAITSKRILRIVKPYVTDEQYDIAIRILKNGLKSHPDDPLLLNRLAEVHEQTGREALAMQYYERVANQSARSELGKAADKRLSQSVPVMTDRERGSIWIAWREVLGVFLLFFLLAWQDAGLNFAQMGASRWMGVLLSLVGGYLVITATSSPQQAPLAEILGGRLPLDNPKTPQRKLNPFASFMTSMGMTVDEESHYVGPIHEPSRLPIIPSWIRLVFGISGTLMLLLAFWLVMTKAIGLLGLPELYLDPEFYGEVFR